MDSTFVKLRQIVSDNNFDVPGTQFAFDTMQEKFEHMVNLTGSEEAPNKLLEYMAIAGTKPAFSTQGYVVVDIKAPSVISPPRPFDFTGSGFVERPARSVGVDFFPLIRRECLSNYFAHQLRWFAHPIRPNVMLPLRMSSYYLGQAHTTSRIYIDMPVVFKTDLDSVNYIRISLNVFEEILFAQSDSINRFIRLVRTRNGSSVRTHAEATTIPSNEQRMWELHDRDYMEYHSKNKKSIDNQPKFAPSALLVADHLIQCR